MISLYYNGVIYTRFLNLASVSAEFLTSLCAAVRALAGEAADGGSHRAALVLAVRVSAAEPGAALVLAVRVSVAEPDAALVPVLVRAAEADWDLLRLLRD